MNAQHARVDKNACIGCGICIDICPTLFEFDPQGLSEATLSKVVPSLTNCAKSAVNACPTNAISLT